MKTTLFRLLYPLAWLTAMPLVVLRLLWRARRQPAYLDHVAERFGRYARPPEQPVLWVHAVSVGETRAAAPLINALLANWPQHSLVLSHMTPTGREVGQNLFANQPRVIQAYLPYDLPWLVERFLCHFQPCIGILMETELWPALVQQCTRQQIPLALVNARLSARSARRYARLPNVTKTLLAPLLIACQSRADARRFRALGAHRLVISGNLKFDCAPPAPMLTLGKDFRARFGQRPVILAASTREGEEQLLLRAFAVHAPTDTLLILVPRHPQRFDEVAAQAHNQGLTLQRRSDGATLAATTRVWLGDSMGEMFAYYAAADVALIGGSWLNYGGQNLIEGCAVGTPVLLGPHTFNFSQAAELAIACGAAMRAKDADEGMRQALNLLEHKALRRQMAQAARRFSAAHRGASARILTLLKPLLPSTDNEFVSVPLLPPKDH